MQQAQPMQQVPVDYPDVYSCEMQQVRPQQQMYSAQPGSGYVSVYEGGGERWCLVPSDVEHV